MNGSHHWVSPLEPPETVLREWFGGALELLFEHLRELPESPACHVEGAAEAARQLVEAMPERGSDAAELLRTLIREYVPRSFNCAGPGYLAYVPGGGLVTAALADLIAGITNRYTGVFVAAPLLTKLEVNVLRWFLDLMGYPSTSRGIFTSGGSLANLIALVCARHRQLGTEFHKGTVYCSDQIHHSVNKAASIAGFRPGHVRLLASDASRKLDPAALREAVHQDRACGWEPAVVVASAGTVHTGAVDDLGALADFCEQEKLWLHVDAAYGGFFQFTDRGRQLFQGIERSDSISMDPHKGLFLPYGTGCLLVRQGEDLREPHSSSSAYLPPMQTDPEAQDFCEYSPELSRDFRGLRVWLSFKLFGARAFREALEEKLNLAREAWEVLFGSPHLEVVGECELSIVAFRIARPGAEGERLTRQLHERLAGQDRFMLSGTLLDGRFTLRLCILNFRTHRDRLSECLAQILRTSEQILEGGSPT